MRLSYKVELTAGLEHFVADFNYFVNVNVTCNCKHHIIEIIEIVVAVVECLRCDFGNGLNRACNIYFDRIIGIHCTKHIKHYNPFAVIVIHTDFLSNNTLLFFDIFFCEMGLLHIV